MSNQLPECPFALADRDIMRNYIERDRELSKLKARSRGRQLLRSNEFRSAITHLEGLQRGAASLYPELVTAENIQLYESWVDSLVESIEQR